MAPNIYWIITTSLIPTNFEMRKHQYIRAISDVIRRCEGTGIKIVIVENNGYRETFLDMFRDYCQIIYTDSNTLDCNYGTREILDVQECVRRVGIQDEDYVVKMTGRYYLAERCPFFDELLKLDQTHYETIIKYGWWEKPSATKVEDCIAGLFCMKAKYVKQVENSFELDFAEYRWARATKPIPDDKICNLNPLGIMIDPGKSNSHFLV